MSLFQLFDSSEFVFDVPPYQRPYAWRTKQIYELLQVRAWVLELYSGRAHKGWGRLGCCWFWPLGAEVRGRGVTNRLRVKCTLPGPYG